MAQRTTASSGTKPNGTHEIHAPDVQDAFQFARSALDFQQQMLGLTSLATDAMRLMLRRTQTHMEYISALSHCRDFASMSAATAEYTQKMGETVSAELQEASHLAERWIAATRQVQHRMPDVSRHH